MSRYLSFQHKKIHPLFILFICLFCSIFFLPKLTLAQSNSTTVIKITPNTNINQLATDYQATITGSIPALAQYQLHSNSPNFLSALAADSRVLLAQSETKMDARPRWIGMNGQDALSPIGTPFVATNPPPAEYTQQWAAQLIRTEQAHTMATGNNVVVAVLDTGIDFDHPWLADKLVAGYDFIDNDAHPAEVANNLDLDGDTLIDEAIGHGTHVAGIVALSAPNAQIMPLRIFNSDGVGQYFDIAQAIVYAVDHGANVINLSGSGPDDVELLQEAILYAQNNNVVVVAAGGINTLDYPASYDGVISVGASDENDYAQPFADYAGNTVTVYAPGASIFSAYYDNSGIGWSGNSMATPFAAGGAALLLSTGQCDADCVYNTIASSSHPVNRNGHAGYRLDLVDMVTAVSETTPSLIANYHVNPGDYVNDDSIQPFLNIQNNGQTISLDDLTLRYWYHLDTVVPEEFHCDYTDSGCAHLTGSFTTLEGTGQSNHYFELGFTNEHNLLGGTNSGNIVIRMNKTDHSAYDEIDHYSYDWTATDYIISEKITLYYQGELIWGTEPNISQPSSPQPTCIASAWEASQVYLGGDQVSYNSQLYRAKWWTTHEQPDHSGEWGVWENIGDCS